MLFFFIKIYIVQVPPSLNQLYLKVIKQSTLSIKNPDITLLKICREIIKVYTLNVLPPINSLKIEFEGTLSLGIPRK